MPREERTIRRVAGIGGHIMPFRVDPESPETWNPYSGDFLEISRWEVLHQYIWVEDTHSGSNGAILRSLVGQDWTCRATLPWNARFAKSRTKESIGFMEEILLGRQTNDNNVSILFAIGDSLSYNQADLGGVDERAALFAKKMALSSVRMVNSNEGRNVFRIEIAGLGNSLLVGYRGDTQKFNFTVEPDEPEPPSGF